MIELEKSIMQLLKSEPFFGFILYKARKVITDAIPTAAVSIKDKIIIYVNEAYFKSRSEEMRQKILKHEILHCIFDHIHRAINNDPKMFNLAADIVINQLVDFPDTDTIEGQEIFYSTLTNLKKAFPKEHIEANQTTEYYYEIIQSIKNKYGNKGNEKIDGMSTSDDHSKWKDSFDHPIAKEVLRHYTREAKSFHEKTGHNYGNLPGEVLRYIEELNKNVLNWKQILKSFISNSEEVLIESSRKRRNRRYGIVQPGARVFSKLRIALILDTSGSTQGILDSFLAEINGIHKANAVVDVIQVDTMVHETKRYNPKHKFEMKGGGGTDMNPGIEAANRMKADSIICLTDGYIPPVKVKPNARFLWCLYGSSGFQAPFGKTLVISEK